MGRGSVRRGEALLAGPAALRPLRPQAACRITRGKGGNTQRYALPRRVQRPWRRSVASLRRHADRSRRRAGSARAAAAARDRGRACGDGSAQERREAKAPADRERHQQARYEAARARRQYDAVDPDNRLVAGELERRWNERLVQLRALEMQLDNLDKRSRHLLSRAADRARLMALGKDLAKAWNSPGVSVETRKKIIRLLVKEIIVDVVEDDAWRSSSIGRAAITQR